MKIAFVWYFAQATQIIDNYRDGLRAAMEIVGQTHQVDWFLDLKLPKPEDEYDWLLVWGDSNLPFFDELDKYQAKKGIFLSTMPQNYDNLKKCDVIWCESELVLATCLANGLNAVKGFGTDDTFFKPDRSIVPDIEYLTIGTFSPWKRQDLLAPLGNRLTAIGVVQPDGQEILETCQKAGVRCITDYIPVEEIRNYYRRAKNVVISAVHGSERTVLESMSMNILPRVLPHNPKTESYVKEFIDSPYVSPRDFIVDRYSAKVYAKQIMEALNG